MHLQNQIDRIREQIINITLSSTAIFMIIAFVPGLLRLLDTGWQPVYLVHIIDAAVIILLYLFRGFIPLKYKTHALFLIYLSIAIMGMINFKLVNAGYYILVVVSLATLLYGKRISFIYSVIFIVLYALIFIGHHHDFINININLDEYQNYTSTWLAVGSSYIFVLVVVIISTHVFYSLFVKSIRELNKKSDELSQSLEALQLSEKKYKDIFENSKDGFLFFDDRLSITACNQSFLKLVGYELDELLAKNYTYLLDNKNYNWEGFIEGTSKNDIKEIALVHKNKTLIPVIASAYRSNVPDGGFWVIIRDIRERKKLEREIFQTMIQSEEKERERYAKELHDGLGPLISTSLIYVNAIQEEGDMTKIKEYSERTYSILEDATNTIKEISNNLSSLILTEYGTVSAIRSFIEKLQQVSDIKFVLKSNLKGTFEELIQFTIYRILVELIHNSVKYSQAKCISILFDYEDGYLKVRFSDDGDGFDYAQALINKKGFGLLNLQNRIKQLGGSSSYYTAPGEGVKVELSIKTNYQ
ncbi:PAS domain-containing sensor histidine kinase [Carboxylicivirga caseinilyticus]|uniref:PAS domain-containing sensor histidine kinase n=1 Tax=Carboxylicivirga caseinilyticus TaxID=3417572 RepID=UPI003D358812|nr:PAS domain S-box protein [Marinilabiliaceae bacterium A049]